MSGTNSSQAAAVAAYANLQSQSPRPTDSPSSKKSARLHLPIPNHSYKSNSSFTSQTSRKSFGCVSPAATVSASAAALAAATRATQNLDPKFESTPNLNLGLSIPAPISNNRNSHLSDISLSSSVSSGQFEYFNSNHSNEIKKIKTNLSLDSPKKFKTDTSASHMINQVKNSINNKNIVTQPSANIRNSTDMKRNSTSDLIKKKPIKNQSSSSVSSIISTNSIDKLKEKCKDRRKPPNELNENDVSNQLSTSQSQTLNNVSYNPYNDFSKSSINYLKPDSSKIRPTIERSSSSFKKPLVPKTQLRKTMRKEPKQKNNFNEDKPWKNHGDISYINDQERKRYEGLWVSNKGLYMEQVVTKLKNVDYNNTTREFVNFSDTAAKLSVSNNGNDQGMIEINQLIHGIIVRNIWHRSRLPDDTLSQIWNLVDRRHDGTLERDEFLVGMWLVDQSLYGRKLPKVLNDAVWLSVERMGINVVIKKRGRR